MTIKVHLPCRARGQERVQRCGYAAFCLNSQKGEQQDRRGDYPRISTNPRLGDLHRHRREALRAPGPAAGRRRLPPVAFQGVLGDLVNNQVPPRGTQGAHIRNHSPLLVGWFKRGANIFYRIFEVQRGG